MRVCLFDTLLERHVAESLARALRDRGHEVVETGPVWHGWRPPESAGERALVHDAVDAVIAGRPEVVLVVRPAALRPDELRRLREQGIRTVAWFSDDPVLYKVQSKAAAADYDLTLHTATEAVLAMYERETGVRGWAFPFWTDGTATPHTYDAGACDLDLVFAGNTHTRVKRWRYEWIAALPVDVKIFGKVAEDPAGIHAGEAPDSVELAAACGRGRFGLNISQRFRDYDGLRFDYPGLADLGEFTVPSRVVQLAAAGCPVISFVGSPAPVEDLRTLFPPVRTVESADELVALVKDTDEDGRRRLSAETFDWYSRHYTASRRAAFLERLLDDDGLLRANTHERATAFMTM